MSAGHAPAPTNPEFEPEWSLLRKQFWAEADDSELRLRYASKWLDGGFSSGRANLIRIQVRLANLEGGIAHPGWGRLRTEAENLLLEESRHWVPGWFKDSRIESPIFHRGFVECVTAHIATLINPSQWKRLFEDIPLRHLNIVGIQQESDLEHLLRRPELQRVLSLSIVGQELNDGAMALISQRSNLSNLRWLSVANNKITQAGFDYLAQMPNLDYLDTGGNEGDCAEQLQEDQGVVVGSRPPKIENFRALRRAVSGGQAVLLNRFDLWRRQSVSMTVGH